MRQSIFILSTIFGLLSVVCCPLSIMAQTEVEPFVPGSTLEGVTYYLPRTAFRVTVIAEKTTTRPGDFHKYADRYLRLQNVPTEESVKWNLKSITFEPYGKPDKNKVYSIKIKSKTVAPLVGLSRDGLLLSINCDANESFLPDLPKPQKGQAPENPRSYMTQEILAAGSTAKMAELTGFSTRIALQRHYTNRHRSLFLLLRPTARDQSRRALPFLAEAWSTGC